MFSFCIRIDWRALYTRARICARAVISPSYSKNDIFSHFRSMQQHVSKFLRAQVRARVYSARQSMRMQKLNIFHIYIVIITSKLTLLWPCKVSRNFSKTEPSPALLNHLEHNTLGFTIILKFQKILMQSILLGSSFFLWQTKEPEHSEPESKAIRSLPSKSFSGKEIVLPNLWSLKPVFR